MGVATTLRGGMSGKGGSGKGGSRCEEPVDVHACFLSIHRLRHCHIAAVAPMATTRPCPSSLLSPPLPLIIPLSSPSGHPSLLAPSLPLPLSPRYYSLPMHATHAHEVQAWRTPWCRHGSWPEQLACDACRTVRTYCALAAPPSRTPPRRTPPLCTAAMTIARRFHYYLPLLPSYNRNGSSVTCTMRGWAAGAGGADWV